MVKDANTPKANPVIWLHKNATLRMNCLAGIGCWGGIYSMVPQLLILQSFKTLRG